MSDTAESILQALPYFVGAVAVEVVCAAVFAAVVVYQAGTNGSPFTMFGFAWGFALDRAPLATEIVRDLTTGGGVTDDVKVVTAGYLLGFTAVLACLRRFGGATADV